MLINIQLVFSCILLLTNILAYAVSSNYEQIPATKDVFEPSFKINTAFFNNLQFHASNCSMVVDKSVLISCQDGYTVIDELYRLKGARYNKLDDSDVLQFDKSVLNMRTEDSYSSLYDRDQDKLNIFNYAGNQVYSLTGLGDN